MGKPSCGSWCSSLNNLPVHGLSKKISKQKVALPVDQLPIHDHRWCCFALTQTRALLHSQIVLFTFRRKITLSLRSEIHSFSAQNTLYFKHTAPSPIINAVCLRRRRISSNQVQLSSFTTRLWLNSNSSTTTKQSSVLSS